MTNLIYLDDHRAGVHLYTPEMGQRKPECKMEARLAYYGKHYFIDTTETINGQGIEFIKTYTEADLVPGSKMVGWNHYKVTVRAFEKLEKKYPISYEAHLD